MNVKYFHLHHKQNHLTVARIKEVNTVYFSYAACCPKDTFSKKLGRQIATGRLLEPADNGMAFKFQMAPGYREIESVLAFIVANKDCFPNSAVKVACKHMPDGLTKTFTMETK